MPQYELAGASGVERHRSSGYEQGRQRPPVELVGVLAACADVMTIAHAKVIDALAHHAVDQVNRGNL